jgi:hypothetical protein
MAERTADQQRKKRQQARERRRSLTSEPFEKLDEAARGDDSSGSHGGAVKQTLATAAAGAVAAGIAGAAKALRDRQSDDEDETQDAEQPEQLEQSEQPEQPEPDEEPNPGPQASAAEEPEESEPEEPAEAEEQDEARDESPAESEQQDKDEDEQRQGVPAGDAKKMVDAARRQLEEILGLEPESVSGFERNGDGWKITLEVVEMHRIPESTDVLSSYEVTVDDDGNVVGASQRRRYRRSQVEDEG